MPPQVLRDYQQRGLGQILDAYRNGARSVLAVSPTGSGKTTIFGSLAARLDSAGRRVLILAHRRELIEQASTRLREFEVQHGIIMAGVPPTPHRRVQIASKDTLVHRLRASAELRAWALTVDLLIVDEAHLSTAETYIEILTYFPNARILGVTATPWRLSGKPLAGAYDACVVVAAPGELRRQGHLSDYVGFSYLAPDLSKLKTTAGDYNEQESARVMSDSLIVDNIVEQWQAHASALSTVVFAVTVDHSRQLCHRFKAAGISAEHLDGETALETRRAILRRVSAGTTRVLCNVGVAVEGLDIPRLKCCVLARPTKSLARAIQMMGRVRRPWKGQVARIHDHAFVIKQHGLPDAERDYTLNAKPEKPPSLTTCTTCRALYSGLSCPACGAAPEPKEQGERKVQTVDADGLEIVEFGSSGMTQPAAPPKPRPGPVEVRWATSMGRVFEGRLTRRWEETRSHGPQRMYCVEGAKRDYHLPGTTRLNALLEHVQIPDSVRIVYTHDTPLPGGKHRMEFKVEVDDGTP